MHNHNSFGAEYVPSSKYTIAGSQMAFKSKYTKQGTDMRNSEEPIVAL